MKSKLILLFYFIIIFSGCVIKKEHNPKFNNNDILEINSDKQTIILIPSQYEIDSIRQNDGNDKLYLMADGANGYLADIYQYFDNNNIEYIISDKRILSFNNSDTQLHKSSLENSWGILNWENDKYTFSSLVDFSIEIANSTSVSIIKKTNIFSTNGIWKTDCEEGIALMEINHDTSIMVINSSHIVIQTLLKKKKESDSYELLLLKPYDLRVGDIELPWDDFSKENPIAKLQIDSSQKTIILDWFGFYNEKTKTREWSVEIDFLIESKSEKILLHQCQE